MAGAYRQPGNHLSTAADSFNMVEFFDFVRNRLENARLSGSHAASIGGDAPPSREAVRFAAAVGQRRIEDEIATLRTGEDGAVEISAAFMGLTGPTGVLPDHYTERVVDHRRERDLALGDFLDLFNHRALSHFWRAWAKYRLPVAFESDGGRLNDSFSRALKALAGLGVAEEAIDDEALLSMSGAMARRVRSAGALCRIINGIYGLPAEVVELQGRWVKLDPADQTRLGNSDNDAGAFTELGRNAIAGAAIWDVGSQFRVRVGPLDFSRFRSFFVAGGPRAAMTDTIRRAVGGNVDFTIQLVLRREDVPMLQLDNSAAPAALGQSTWLLGGPAANDRDEARLSSAKTSSLTG